MLDAECRKHNTCWLGNAATIPFLMSLCEVCLKQTCGDILGEGPIKKHTLIAVLLSN
jgi:hypothetical protein